jgi:Asp/Glu/hydantoin racemase
LKAKNKLRKRFRVPVEDPVFDGVKRIADVTVELRDR